MQKYVNNAWHALKLHIYDPDVPLTQLTGTKMKILVVVPYTPTLIRTRPYNLVRGLARRGHAVTLATLWENGSERVALAQWERAGIRVIAARLTKPRAVWNMLRALPTNMPLQAVYCWHPELLKIIRSQIPNLALREAEGSPFDVVHVEHLRGSQYALRLKSSLSTRHLSPPVVWDSVDCISHLFEQAAHYSRSPFGRFVTRFELVRTRRYEALLVNQFDRVLVTSPVDAAALMQLANTHSGDTGTQRHGDMEQRDHRVTVLPNGVDREYFVPSHAPRDSDTIVFTGKLSYHANVTAALHLVNDIMPLIWRERPNVRVNIVGYNPPRRLQNSVTGHACAPFAQSARVTLTGFVPDLRPYLQGAAVAVAPMPYGAGIQNKVLEAMGCATPVVATPQAVSALQVTDGEELLIGGGTDAFARQVLRLLNDAGLRERIGSAGRKFVEQNHDWNRIAERLEEIYRAAVNRLTN